MRGRNDFSSRHGYGRNREYYNNGNRSEVQEFNRKIRQAPPAPRGYCRLYLTKCGCRTPGCNFIHDEKYREECFKIDLKSSERICNKFVLSKCRFGHNCKDKHCENLRACLDLSRDRSIDDEIEDGEISEKSRKRSHSKTKNSPVYPAHRRHKRSPSHSIDYDTGHEYSDYDNFEDEFAVVVVDDDTKKIEKIEKIEKPKVDLKDIMTEMHNLKETQQEILKKLFTLSDIREQQDVHLIFL